MQIIKIISTYKRKFNVWQYDARQKKWARRNMPPRNGYKRVMAIVNDRGLVTTRHIDVPI